MGTPTPGQADAEPPALYARWVRADFKDATDGKVARLWRAASEGDRQFWTGHVADVMKLSDTLTELLSLFDFNSKGWNVARVSDEHLDRLRARLEPS